MNERMNQLIDENNALKKSLDFFAWHHVTEKMPEVETPVIVALSPTPAQLEVELENYTVISAAWDGAEWYEWTTDNDIDTSKFHVLYWMNYPINPMQSSIDAEVELRRNGSPKLSFLSNEEVSQLAETLYWWKSCCSLVICAIQLSHNRKLIPLNVLLTSLSDILDRPISYVEVSFPRKLLVEINDKVESFDRKTLLGMLPDFLRRKIELSSEATL